MVTKDGRKMLHVFGDGAARLLRESEGFVTARVLWKYKGRYC